MGRRASSRRRVRILPPWRRTTRRSASRPRKAWARRRATETRSKSLFETSDAWRLLRLDRCKESLFSPRIHYFQSVLAREELAHVLMWQVFESRKVFGLCSAFSNALTIE